MQNKPHGMEPKPVDGTKTPPVLPQTDQVYMPLREREFFLLRNGMLNLEADIESALYQVVDALMLPSVTEVRHADLADRLICLKRLLNKSLHSLRDWKLSLLKG